MHTTQPFTAPANKTRTAAAPHTTQPFTPLAQEHRTAISTAEAAFHLGRAPQTLRVWACLENGPIRPIRVNGRLAWPVSEIKRLLGCVTE